MYLFIWISIACLQHLRLSCKPYEIMYCCTASRVILNCRWISAALTWSKIKTPTLFWKFRFNAVRFFFNDAQPFVEWQLTLIVNSLAASHSQYIAFRVYQCFRTESFCGGGGLLVRNLLMTLGKPKRRNSVGASSSLNRPLIHNCTPNGVFCWLKPQGTILTYILDRHVENSIYNFSLRTHANICVGI